VQILKRDPTVTDSIVPKNVTTQQKSLEERELEYRLARQRIFGSMDDSESSKDSNVNNDINNNNTNSNNNCNDILNRNGIRGKDGRISSPKIGKDRGSSQRLNQRSGSQNSIDSKDPKFTQKNDNSISEDNTFKMGTKSDKESSDGNSNSATRRVLRIT